MSLPQVLSPAGELVRLVSADDLLHAAGLHDLTTADAEQLAAFTDNADHLTAIAREAKVRVGGELVDRMDRRGKWTFHVGEFDITAPSPDAGATAYDTDMLVAALERLVSDGVIDREAMDAAVELVTPEPYRKQKAAGIKALLKVPAARDAVEACRVEVEPPRRTAKVKRVRS